MVILERLTKSWCVRGMLIGGFCGVGLVFLGGAGGSKEPLVVDEFMYNSQQARIMHEEVNFGPDRYFVNIGDKKDRLVSTFTGDEGRIFRVGPNSYTVREVQQK